MCSQKFFLDAGTLFQIIHSYLLCSEKIIKYWGTCRIPLKKLSQHGKKRILRDKYERMFKNKQRDCPKKYLTTVEVLKLTLLSFILLGYNLFTQYCIKLKIYKFVFNYFYNNIKNIRQKKVIFFDKSMKIGLGNWFNCAKEANSGDTLKL